MGALNIINSSIIHKKSAFELVRNKNLNLAAGEYNTASNVINSGSLLSVNEDFYKKTIKKKESIVARLDTDINIKKKDGNYLDDIQVNNINDLKGSSNKINVIRNKWIDKSQPKLIKKPNTRIENNVLSGTIRMSKVDKANKNLKNYKYNKTMNSTPVNENMLYA